MRKGELILNCAFIFTPLVFGLCMAWASVLVLSMPQAAFTGMICLFLIGFILFAKAKLSIIGQGYLFTFGSTRMSKNNRVTYFAGYILMGMGLFLFIGFTMVLR